MERQDASVTIKVWDAPVRLFHWLLVALVVFVGELGLGGELRRVQRVAVRLKEAQRLGFTRAVVPQASLGDLNGIEMDVVGAATLREALGRSGIAEG